MSKKPLVLTYTDIVLGADVETIRRALEARTEIDQLLEERAKAYAQIAELEGKVEALMEEGTVFPYPEPPLPVFGFGPAKGAAKAKKKVAPKVAPPAPAKGEGSTGKDSRKEAE